MIRDRNQIVCRYVRISALLLISWAGIIRFCVMPRLTRYIEIIWLAYYILLILGISILVLYMIFILCENRIHKGFKYCFTHYIVMRKVRSALKNSGYYIETNMRGEKVAVLPKIKIMIDTDMQSGKLCIENHVKYDKRLEDVKLSSCLGRFIVSEQYCSDDCNWYVYEFEDASLDRRFVFKNVEQLKKCAWEGGDCKFKIDKKVTVPLSSALYVGATGSGKTYLSYYLILTMLCWESKPILYFADPKNSSLIALGNVIDVERTAGDTERIVSLLEKFNEEMEQRKIELQGRLSEKLDADYRDFGFSPHVFVIDEYSSFMSSVNEEKKQIRDHVAKLVRTIVLQGRQLGFMIFVLMQKSDASDIPTSIRSNLIFTVVLGNATRTTLITAFEESADVPIRKFGKGEGVYTYQGLTRQPSLISFPTLDFDILDATKQLL